MTESEWRDCSNPMAMLAVLRGAERLSERQARLFAVACTRRIWSAIGDSARAAVVAAEQYADGKIEAEELRAARLACKSAGSSASWYAAASNAEIAARNAAL